MKTKIIVVSILFLLGSMCLMAEKKLYSQGESAIHLIDGRLVVLKIVDWNNRNMDLKFNNGTSINKSRIWMLNFINRDWNFPTERGQMGKKSDTIFLKNGDVVFDTVVDFSSRRRVFEFLKHKAIHISKIKRMYFCVCTTLPDSYRDKVRSAPMMRKFNTARKRKKINQ